MDNDLIHGVERLFFSLEELQPQEKEFNIMLKIGNHVSWALKFRHSGLIYNRLDLVLADCITCDGTINVPSATVFHRLVMGDCQLDDEVKQDRVKIHMMSAEIFHLFKARFPPASATSTLGSSSSQFNLPSSGHLTHANMNETNMILANRHNINANTVLNSDEKPLKSGWLLKKRDIISGWKRRYFELYSDRLVYFTSPEDTLPTNNNNNATNTTNSNNNAASTVRKPRGSYPLYGVGIVATVKPIRIKRKAEHYGIILELRSPEKTIKLATEKTGLEGKVEADSWCQALIKVSNNRPGDAFNRAQNNNNNKLASSSGNNSNKNSSNANHGNSARNQMNNGTSSDGSKAGKSVRHKVARFVRRFTQKNLLSQSRAANGNKEEKHGLLPILLYGGGICGLTVALFYAWYVTQSLSTKTFVTLSVLMLVLLAIFVQEFILDDMNDEVDAIDFDRRESFDHHVPQARDALGSSGQSLLGTVETNDDSDFESGDEEENEYEDDEDGGSDNEEN